MIVFCVLSKTEMYAGLEQHEDELMMTELFLIVIIWVEYPFELCSLRYIQDVKKYLMATALDIFRVIKSKHVKNIFQNCLKTI